MLQIFLNCLSVWLLMLIRIRDRKHSGSTQKTFCTRDRKLSIPSMKNVSYLQKLFWQIHKECLILILFDQFYKSRSWLQNSSLLGNCKKTTSLLSCLSFLLYAHIKEELGSWKLEGETCLINWYRKLLQATTWIACPICSSLERSDLNHWWDLIELHESTTVMIIIIKRILLTTGHSQEYHCTMD